MPDLLAAVKAGDAAAVRGAAGARSRSSRTRHEDGIPAVRIALYHRQPAVLQALLAAQPPLDGLDHAALGWAEDLRDDLAADAELAAPPAPPTASPRCTTHASSAARQRPRCCSRPAPSPAPRRRTRPRCGRCTRPPPHATPSPRGCCWKRAPIPTPARPAASPRCMRPPQHDDDGARRAAAPARRRPHPAQRQGRRRGGHRARGRARSPCWRCWARRPPEAQAPKWTLPFERARACARSMKSSRLIAPRNSRVISFSRAVSERRSSSPCFAAMPNSTVAAIW